MRNRTISASLGLLLVLAMVAAAVYFLRPCNPMPGTLPPIELYFSPNGGCTDAVVREIHAAGHTILVQAYSLTSTPIAQALVDAHRRGIEVKVIFDKKRATEEYSLADMLRAAGVPVRLDAIHAIAHNKVIILDGEVVITGSFNFTKQAEHSNAENLLVIRDRAIADRYKANWEEHAAHSEVSWSRDTRHPQRVAF
jgi:phosphatidylserine/phosphatidylglycerophosphate/cardiolipin synthase-like enzyme